jgi:hypothetical protein
MQSSASSNTSALAEYNKQLNIYANVRDSLITYITDLAITTVDSIKLQACSLAQFTQATNQLTRTTLVIARVFLFIWFIFRKIDACIG